MSGVEYAEKIVSELGHTMKHVRDEAYDELAGRIQRAKRMFVAGSGRSGLMMRAFAMRLMQMGLPCHVIGETVTPAAQRGELLVIGSGSGETEALVAMARKAHAMSVSLALITVMPRSTIGKLADLVVTIPATTAKADGRNETITVQPRGSLFEQCLLIFLETVIVLLMERMDFKPDDIMKRHANLE
jgi:6-phospho-3-hexuloisomerase